jgi:DNA processing protein
MHNTHSFPITQLDKVAFPERLLEIPKPPEQLYVRGTLPSFDDNTFLAVVGSRNASSYGKEVCAELIAGLQGYPIVIVSGLAIGIDALAHKAALAAGLTTLAIPGSGLSDQVLHPSSNRALAQKILEAGGALLSEYEPDFQATLWSFPQRNRVMAGLSHAVLVIEASDRSGTLITARLATEYNREVLAVPGSIFSQNSFGPLMLMRQGATPIRNSADILDVFGMEKDETGTFDVSTLSEPEQKICARLTSPMPRDELIRTLDMPVSQAQSLLMAMELKGLIKETLGEIRMTV